MPIVGGILLALRHVQKKSIICVLNIGPHMYQSITTIGGSSHSSHFSKAVDRAIGYILVRWWIEPWHTF